MISQMNINLYQEYDGEGNKVLRSLTLITNDEKAYFVNRDKIVPDNLAVARSLVEDRTVRLISREEAIKEVPELEAFLQHLPTLVPTFVAYPLTHGG